MKIGELARQSGLSIDTLRFYEKIGLIDPPARDAGGRRDYGSDVLVWVAFLAKLNATGMKQSDRVRYAQLRRLGDKTATERRELLEAHREAVKTAVQELQDSLILLNDKIDSYRDIVAKLNPPLETLLAESYDDLVPDFAETLVEWAYGRQYARPGLDLKTRQLCTVAALTAMGGQTAPQLKVNIEHALAAGASRTEIIEAIWQMAVYGGLPAAINGLNAVREVFGPERTQALGG